MPPFITGRTAASTTTMTTVPTASTVITTAVPTTKAKDNSSTMEEPMDTNMATTSSPHTRHSSHISERTHRSQSLSTTQDTDGKGVRGKSSSTWTAPKSREPEKRPGPDDPAIVSATLLKAGGAAPLGKDVGSIPKRVSEKGYVVDYSKEPCPAPTFKIDQPSGSHLVGSPSRPSPTQTCHMLPYIVICRR